jgi:aspartate carbamoyltransferase
MSLGNSHLPFGDKQDSPFYGMDILSVNQFDRGNLQYLFDISHEMFEMVRRVGSFDLLKGKIMTSLFYEPSTRTSSSFISAMERLGGSVIAINDVSYSSVTKGETLTDTIRTMEAYSDVIVLRHPEIGSATLAAKYAKKPIINAGDGAGEHPTQALLDLFTIKAELGHIDGLTVTMMGDLKYGRTVHSLARLLTLYDVRLNYVSPEVLSMPEEIMEEINQKGIPQTAFNTLETVLPQSDVLYVTRVQKERFNNPQQYEDLKGGYIVTSDTLRIAKPSMIIMHPLPRVWEIDMEVDNDPRAAYFRQLGYGLYVRMALLSMVLGKA